MSTESEFAADFPQAEFEDATRQTMKMGMPENDDEKLKWWWRRDKTYSPDDFAEEPYDWTAPPVTDEPGNPDLADTDDGSDQYLIVDYAIEFSSRPAGSVMTVLGEIDNSRAVITLLESDFLRVSDPPADYATIGDTEYRVQFDSPAMGLFGATVRQVILEAVDES